MKRLICAEKANPCSQSASNVSPHRSRHNCIPLQHQVPTYVVFYHSPFFIGTMLTKAIFKGWWIVCDSYGNMCTWEVTRAKFSIAKILG